MKYFLFTALLMPLSSMADPHHTPVAMPKEFDVLKQLVGSWQGTTSMEGKEVPVTVVYELTSGGTAVTEKLNSGTPHEMISVYHKDGKSLGMTHYCSMGNSPQMNLKKADGKSLAFEMGKPLGLTSPSETHMHAVTLTLGDKDTLQQEWVSYENGKQKSRSIFAFKRKN